jgi:hypothetical protein
LGQVVEWIHDVLLPSIPLNKKRGATQGCVEIARGITPPLVDGLMLGMLDAYAQQLAQIAQHLAASRDTRDIGIPLCAKVAYWMAQKKDGEGCWKLLQPLVVEESPSLHLSELYTPLRTQSLLDEIVPKVAQELASIDPW